MDMHGAKLEMLQKLIDSMTGRMLEGGKKKPVAAQIEIQADAKPEAALMELPEEGDKEAEDGMDGDSLRGLMELYGKDADEVKKEDDDE